MKVGDPIDVWFGIGDGESLRIKGEYISEDVIHIVDSEFLESTGWDNPHPYDSNPLPETRWVQYDDFAWSAPGVVPEGDLRSGKYLSPLPEQEKEESFGGEVRFHKVYDL